MQISDIIVLAKAGFNREDIARIAQALAPVTASNANSATAKGVAGTPSAGGLSTSFTPALASQTAAQTAPVVPVPPAPVQTAAGDANPAAVSGAGGDMLALFGAVNKLQTSINQLATPQAGAVGAAMEPVTSIEDIIRGPVVHNDAPVTGYPFNPQNK